MIFFFSEDYKKTAPLLEYTKTLTAILERLIPFGRASRRVRAEMTFSSSLNATTNVIRGVKGESCYLFYLKATDLPVRRGLKRF